MRVPLQEKDSERRVLCKDLSVHKGLTGILSTKKRESSETGGSLFINKNFKRDFSVILTSISQYIVVGGSIFIR